MTTYKERELFMKTRILFVERGCPHCAKWLEFIESLNMNLPIEKRILVIDCSQWVNLGTFEYQIIQVYKKYITGFPSLFYEGRKLEGSNSREELEAFIKVMLEKDFIMPVKMRTRQGKSLTFNKVCKFKRTWYGGRKIICE